MEKVEKKKHLRIFVIIISILLVVLLGVIVFGGYVLSHYYDNQIGAVEVTQEMQANMEKSMKVELNDTDLSLVEGGKATENIYKVKQKNEDIINVLLVGMDARSYETSSRSDAMILASYNKQTHSVKLVSFLRDSWVHLPEYGWSRINTATAYGGVGLLVNTLNENFDLDIQHYVQIRFEGFREVIDILGGIDVELTQSEINYINRKLHVEDRDWKNDIKAQPGIVHLNGAQALWHCRNRSIGNGDFARTERQRHVLEIMLNKALSMNLTQITQLAYEMKDHVDMNVPISTVVGLAKEALFAGDVSLESHKIPFDEHFKYANKYGASVIELDMESTTEELHKIIGFIKDEEDSSEPAKGLAIKENDVKYDLSNFEE